MPAAHRPATQLSKSPPTTNEYTSTAPIPALPPQHTDEAVPSHLYHSLPHHFLVDDAHGRRVPDYLRMILMCELLWRRNTLIRAAKVYSAPLNLKETPLTYAVNLSARLGNEVSVRLCNAN